MSFLRQFVPLTFAKCELKYWLKFLKFWAFLYEDHQKLLWKSKVMVRFCPKSKLFLYDGWSVFSIKVTHDFENQITCLKQLQCYLCRSNGMPSLGDRRLVWDAFWCQSSGPFLPNKPPIGPPQVVRSKPSHQCLLYGSFIRNYSFWRR